MANETAWICERCACLTTFEHDHRPDGTGIDDGPELFRIRKKSDPKSDAECARIRAAAWETRRLKYGKHGHR